MKIELLGRFFVLVGVDMQHIKVKAGPVYGLPSGCRGDGARSCNRVLWSESKRKVSLRAAAKLSHQGKSNTRAPRSAATSRVLSVEPVSTTTISSASPWTESKHRPSDCSSLRTIRDSFFEKREFLPQNPEKLWKT